MLSIRKSGLQTAVQDLGRTGFQRYGVIASGVMDPFAHRIANLLVGNIETSPTLEIALSGPVIEFETDHFIAICGGDLSPSIDGKPLPMWRGHIIRKGSVLSFGEPKRGARSYLAVAGSFDIPAVMDSHSTYLRAGIGGFQGRALKTGDTLKTVPISTEQLGIFQRTTEQSPDWLIPPARYHVQPVVRMIPGRQYPLFNEESRTRIFEEAFTVSSNSDRMGYRLEGPELALDQPKELISEAVAFGSVQVPADGNPIVLLADRQTTGGYPKIGQVASVDLPLISQLKPGESLKFREISVKQAEQLYIEQEQQIRQLKIGIQMKREEWT
ncbi:biotin-dependent carboxyltransferase family protein [Planococcus sp. ISL-109]|uniref:5-oxoprolinase subunit C family protein n=1 Tax=Planococcus sp. ISL-109 TaxID=2819166 RepID=UPI001BE58DA8|nr:biotin-dependent carboxyltransferase family protein [Planococcus sp. ISL-109]MBT2581519.1 biotin-dependent carboxyltransferase family protein [Planococcus sp. ISL-109]